MLRTTLLSLTLSAGLLAASGGAFFLLVATRPTPPPAERPESLLLVQVQRLEPQTIVEPVLGFGTARPFRAAWIAPQVAGQVVELAPGLRAGAQVEQGQLLVRIDDREYQQRLELARRQLAAEEVQLQAIEVEAENLARLIDIAQSELRIAEREYQRVLALFERQQAPQRELDLARQSYETARAALQRLDNDQRLLPTRRAWQAAQRGLRAAEVELARLDVERCRITAPFSGQVERLDVEVGERVGIGQQILRVVDPRRIEIPIELPVSMRDRVAAGRRCRLWLESRPEQIWEGSVARLAPVAQEQTRTFALFVEVDTQAQRGLLPGMFVRAEIEGPTHAAAIVVPRGAIQDGCVFVYEDGAARRRPVRVVQHALAQSIVEGLRPGETVITSNLDILRDGQPVRAADAPDGGGVAGQPHSPPRVPGR